MNCKYCNKECFSMGDFNRINDTIGRIYQCTPCGAVFRKEEISISCKIKNKTWVVTLNDNQTIIGNAWNPGLFKFSHRLNIVPSNIVDKIKLYVLFS